MVTGGWPFSGGAGGAWRRAPPHRRYPTYCLSGVIRNRAPLRLQHDTAGSVRGPTAPIASVDDVVRPCLWLHTERDLVPRDGLERVLDPDGGARFATQVVVRVTSSRQDFA